MSEMKEITLYYTRREMLLIEGICRLVHPELPRGSVYCHGHRQFLAQNCVARLLRLANWALERQLQNGVEL